MSEAAVVSSAVPTAPRTFINHVVNADCLTVLPKLASRSIDFVLTDPPYFGNVQYGELMDFCYVWLRRLVGTESEGFDRESTRSPDELTGNLTADRDINHFANGLSAVYRRIAPALKPGAPLAFTFHHNRLEAYHAVGIAMLDAGFACSATLPCPAEMGGSIHIHGTRSSIVDTIFVCRLTGRKRRGLLFDTGERLREIVEGDLARLRAAGVNPTVGDIRCIIFGHLTRMTVWRLRPSWDPNFAIDERVRRFANELKSLADIGSLIHEIGADSPERRFGLAEQNRVFELDFEDAVPF